MTKPLVIGIGNPLLQDDRAGLAVLERLIELQADVDTCELYTVGFSVLDALLGREKAVIVDACFLGNEPGHVLETDAETLFSDDALAGSHAMTLGATLKLGYELYPDEMPRDLKLMLIEAKTIEEFSPEMTPAVAEAVDRVARRIAAG